MSSTTSFHNDSVRLTKAEGATFQAGLPAISGTPSPGHLLVENVAVASNPKDWKISAYGMWEGVEGNDIAGHIVAVAPDVKEFKVGDAVVGFTPMATHDKYGAYQRYTEIPEYITSHVPKGLSFEGAATLPLAALTAAVGLFSPEHLALTEPDDQGKAQHDVNDKQTIVVWGASSSVGSYVVQLAKLAGYYVVGVASSSKDLARRLGSDDIVDYKAVSAEEIPTALLKAGTASGRSIIAAYDAISEHGSVEALVRLFELQGKAVPAAITTVLPTKYDQTPGSGSQSEQHPQVLPSHLRLQRTFVGATHNTLKELGTRWIRRIATWSSQDVGLFQPNKVEVVPRGLKGVPVGLDKLRNGQVSGVKLVYVIKDTPQ